MNHRCQHAQSGCNYPEAQCVGLCIRRDCVEHTQKGHPKRYATASRNGVICKLHRWVFCETNGMTLSQIQGLVVRHKCDNPSCINPQHLELGTHTDNARDCIERGRRNDHKGTRNAAAKLDEAQVEMIRSSCKPNDATNGVRALARRLGVSASTVSMVLNKKRWSWK